jgi:phosphoribosylformimino-5-aminoimidazole carboxamide ribotide isomerase
MQSDVMRLIGVIDLLGGRAVHARGGRRATYQPVQSRLLAEDEAGDAVALARAYRRLGAEIYLADLDAIGGAAPNLDLIAATGADFVDAGVRDVERAELLRHHGTSSVVVALETMESWEQTHPILKAAGWGMTAFSLDLYDRVPLGSMSTDPLELAEKAMYAGMGTIIVLDLARVGALVGLDVSMLAAIREAAPEVRLIVGGGIRDEYDVEVAAQVGCDGVLVGTALHVGSIPAIGARFS